MTDWAAKVMEGVVRYRPKPPGVMVPDQTGVWVDHRHVTDAIAKLGAGDGLVERLNRADEYEPLGHDGWEAAARIAALTATVAELEGAQREVLLQSVSDLSQAQEARESQLAAEADNATLRARLARMEGALTAIDALDPEGRIGDCSVNAISGLVLRMGEIARAALTDGGSNG